MGIKIYNPQNDLQSVCEIWNYLNPEHSYFLSWGWIENWLVTLPKDIHIQFAVVSNQNTPVRAFFFHEKKVVRKHIFRSHSYFLNATGNEEFDRLCIEYNAIAGEHATVDDFRSILEVLPKKWEEVHLPGLDKKGFPGKVLDGEIHPYRVIIEKEEPSPFVDLVKIRENKGDYLALISQNTRAQIRRSYRRLAARGPIRVEVASDLEKAGEFFNELTTLHQKTWESRGEEGVFKFEYFNRFHKALILKRFHLNEIQLIRVTAGNETIGCLYNFVKDGHVFFYQSGINYDMDQQCRPGIVCQVEAIRVNAEQGHNIYDFLAGTSQYKASLSTGENCMVWAKIQKPLMKFWIEQKLRSIKSLV